MNAYLDLNIVCDFVFCQEKNGKDDEIISDFVLAGAVRLRSTLSDTIELVYAKGADKEDDNEHLQRHLNTFFITVKLSPDSPARAYLSIPTWRPDRIREYLLDIIELASKVKAKVYNRLFARYIEIDSIDEIITHHLKEKKLKSGRGIQIPRSSCHLLKRQEEV